MARLTTELTRKDTARSFDYIPVAEHAAIIAGTSTYNAAAALNEFLSSGGLLEFNPGTYLVGSSLAPASNTAIKGNGATIKCPDAGWTLVSQTGYGIINLYQKENVSIDDLSLYGTLNAVIGLTPKLVYYEAVENIRINGGLMQNSAFEGIWGGGNSETNVGLSLTNIRMKEVGYPAGAFGALPGFQLNCVRSVVAGNRIKRCGIGIGNSGAENAVTGNGVYDPYSIGISTGDGLSGPGNVHVGNSITLFSHASLVRRGILIEDGPSTPVGGVLATFDGNNITIWGTVGHTMPRGIRSSGELANFSNNDIWIDTFGAGVEMYGITGVAKSDSRNNRVHFTNEGATCYGFVGIPNGSGKTLKAYVGGCRVSGLGSTYNSYAYDFNSAAGGTLQLALDAVRKDGGIVRYGATSIAHADQNDANISQGV